MTYLVDGNAHLFAAYGREMTNALGMCRGCESASGIAELPVYARGPGAVARCSGCNALLLVLVKIGAACHVHLAEIKLHE